MKSASESGPIGAVFTPPAWADWGLCRLAVLDRLEAGARVCDPTAGEGSFIMALARQYQARHGRLDAAAMARVWLIEKEPSFLSAFARNFRESFGIDFPPENLIVADMVSDNPGLRFDCLVGNPPWANFSDLPESLKPRLKKYFFDYGLVQDARSLLLGGARIDLAALVMNALLANNCLPGAVLGFFLPLSLFMNEGAHAAFRRFRAGAHAMKLEEIHDFGDAAIFEKVATRFCFARFTASAKTEYPIAYHVFAAGEWQTLSAAPIAAPGSALIAKSETELRAFKPGFVELDPWQKPRQGVNSCGANDVYISKDYPSFAPERYVYPLLSTAILRGERQEPEKFIVLPYREDGKVMSLEELRASGLYDYFLPHREKLSARKGVLINRAIKKGLWWSLLGLGPYSFAPCKLVWTSLGARDFSPVVVSSWRGRPWQANQAMQAFIPAESIAEAYRIASEFRTLDVARHLSDQRGCGGLSWAQPGRIAHFLKYREPKDLSR